MRLKLCFFLALLPLWHSGAANAAVTVGATRLIYDGASNEANLTISNREDTSPYLVQSWVSRFGSGNDESVDSFIVTPPLFRLDANKENILRIIFAGGPQVPQDRESLFLMNVKAIPAMSDDQKGKNVLQIALKTTIKLFYRPAGLQGSLPEAVEKLQWRAEGGKLTVQNPSGYNVVVSDLLINNTASKGMPEVIKPGSTVNTTIPLKSSDKLELSYINEYGSTVKASLVTAQ